MDDGFFEIPGNPAPDRGTVGTFLARDRRRIRYALFRATSHPLKGTVVLLHGRNEFIEKYFETTRDLTGRGFTVATLDWRGQGGSDRMLRNREKGYIDDFRDYVRDLEQFFEEIVLPDCRGPYYVLGHSTGSLVALMAAPDLTNRVNRMLLCAPLLSLAGLPVSMKALARISGFLYGIGLGSMYLSGGPRPRETRPFADNKLTTDPRRYARNAELYDTYRQLALGGPTVAWIRAACIAIERVEDPAFMARIQIPILFVAAGADEVVSTRATEAFARRLKTGSLLTIDGARHEIWQETDLYREQLLAAFDAFIPGSDPTV
jgi:lysophospholipase